MLYQIYHRTHYRYHQPVFLKPHRLRLSPRADGWQSLQQFDLQVSPQPQGIAEVTDLDGNHIQRIWFVEPTEELVITVTSQVLTHMENPFNFLLEPWAVTLPFDYPLSLYRQLKPYWYPYSTFPDPTVITLAQEIALATQHQPLDFLYTLTQRLYQECDYTLREHGQPIEAGTTWRNKQGSCRDLTILFMEVCRTMGLAVRFVSGYQEGDQGSSDWELHAWAEVYLPGGGWRGYDPTHGLAVSDRHIALVASPNPQDCAPVTGDILPVRSFRETGQPFHSTMSTKVQVTTLTGMQQQSAGWQSQSQNQSQSQSQ